jgi:hypothetical protein
MNINDQSADSGGRTPTSADTDPTVAVQTVQTSSTQVRSTRRATVTGDGDGDEIEAGVQRKHVLGRNQGKGKGKKLQAGVPELETVLLPGDIGLPW